MKRHITTMFIIFTVLMIAAFDIWVIAEAGKESSISHVLIEWSHEYPSVPFLLGYVMGHLTWRLKSTDIMRQKGID